MEPSDGRTTKGECPICNLPYRDADMVECTICQLWFCYECVQVTDNVAEDDNWRCPLCKTKEICQEQKLTVNLGKSTIKTISRKSSSERSNKISTKISNINLSKKSSISSKSQMKLQLIHEEKNLIRQERELIKEARRILEEDEIDDSSQDVSDSEIKGTDIIANKLLSLEIDNFSERKKSKNIPKNTGKLNEEFPMTEKANVDQFTINHQEKSQNLNQPNLFRSIGENQVIQQQFAARKSIPQELPTFDGNSHDWPLFISSYERSTELCGFDNNENLMRLQKSLKGIARNAVTSFLILPECVPEIISTLRLLFGRPEQIIESYINAIRRQPPPRAEKLETLIEFALAIKNLCISLKAAKLHEYLNNPTLMHELIEKLPSQIKINWALYRGTLKELNGIQDFSDWMYNMATNLCTALPSLAMVEQKPTNQRRDRANIHDTTENNDKKCIICDGKCQNASKCETFEKYSLVEKWNQVKKLQLCRLCLKRHRFPCKYPVKCQKNQCERKHHPLLHKDEEVDIEKEDIPPAQISHQVSVSENMVQVSQTQNIRFRIVPIILKHNQKEVKTYAFLDEGSSVTLVNENITKELGLEGKEDQLCLQWTGNVKRFENNSRKVQLTIRGDFHGAKQFELCPARTVHSLNLPQQSLDANELKESYSYLTNLPFKSYNNANPQILIGLDNWKLALPLRIKEGTEYGQPIAAKCRLGWSVFALLPEITETKFSYHICECFENDISNEKLHGLIKEYFSLESLGVQAINCMDSKELQRARDIQQSTLVQDGMEYKIGLLWKYDNISLPDSKNMALQRLKCIENRIKYNPDLGTKINEQIQDFIQKKYIRKLNHDELHENYDKIWYLPIFPVFNPNKPGKFRIVWDAAATVQGISLNSMLLKGDDQLVSLLGVLLRFRERKFGFSADIKEMFLRIGVIKEDQQAQRFLWRNGNSEDYLETYIMTAMTFGATCSPSNAQFVKNTNARKFINEYPRAVECIINNHYVDDLLDSANSEEEAVQIAQQVKYIHSQGNFEIRNWHSNSNLLCNTMNSKKEKLMEVNMNIERTEYKEKVLGMWWDTEKDVFMFSLKFNKGNREVLNGDRKPTKRELLQILMSIYDPLGLLAKFLVYLKILLQEIWRSNISWDQTINDDQFRKWLIWLKQLPKIENILIPRCYLNNFKDWNDTKTELHIFVDASEHASATVAYLRIQKQDQVECVLVGAKTQVAPIKLITIPRLELNGALMGARFGKHLNQLLSIKITETFFWSDSIIVLSWLRTEDPRKLMKYVSYRVAEIQENSMISNWKYVPTKLNVADEATKWKDTFTLDVNNRWFKGPEFLYSTEQYWPTDITNNQIQTEEYLSKHEIIEPLIKIDNFSKFQRLVNAMAYVYRGISIFYSKLKKLDKPTGPLTSQEILKSRNALVHMVQTEKFQDEIKDLQKKNTNLQPTVKKTSQLYKLSPYLDEYGLLRVRGRIDAATNINLDCKRPIILPRDSYLTLLIIEYYHDLYQHHNHETVINEIRQKYYISKLRRLLNKVKKDCLMCKIKFTLPIPPEMSPLPECRVSSYTSPFTFTGVDYFGPIHVAVGRRSEKRWGALFTCLTTRSIHLEIAHKLDADSCILCFQNFMSRRGRPRHIYCDRGTNFIATERILREELQKVDSSKIAKAFLSSEITFHFNSPLSPHMGGAWERLVKSVKISLYAALPSRKPSDPLLQSCLIATENIVNSRPLTYLPLESEQSEALTPNHFLIGSSSGDKPMGMFDDNSTILKCNYLYREQYANKCWKRFVAEYIPKLLLRSKWYKQVDAIKEGDIVIICDKDLPRCNWPKGKVIKINKSKDGQVRKALVQTTNGIFERPVVKLAILTVENKNKGSATQNDCAEPGGSVKNKKIEDLLYSKLI